MKLRLRRRESILITGTAAISNNLSGLEKTGPKIIHFERKHASYFLRNLAATEEGFFAVWRTHPIKGEANLVFYSQEGKEVWSQSMGQTQILQAFVRKTGIVTLAQLDPKDRLVHMLDFDSSGNQTASIPAPAGKTLVSFAGNDSTLFALDGGFKIYSHRKSSDLWVEEVSGIAAPSVAGLTPAVLAGSIHNLGAAIGVLDHISGRFGTGSSSTPLHVIEPNHQRITALQIKNSARATSNLADVAQGLAFKVPLTFYMAVGNSSDTVYGFFQANGKKVSVARFSLQVPGTTVCDLEIPADDLIQSKPPLLASATKDHIFLGYQVGTILQYSLTKLESAGGWS